MTHLDVFISSTSIDLPDHRQAVIDALLAIGLFPNGMEHWPVKDEHPVDFCRQKVEAAELFIGIYAHRYGWRPDGPGTKSITEMEYEWAGELSIPRFCFVMDKSYPWPPDQMELEAKSDLDAFKARVSERIRGIFTTPDNLRAQLLEALAPYAQKQDLRGIAPYLSKLHHDSLQSGLLRTLDPRMKDPSHRGGQVTVDQVYTPLDTRLRLFRDDQYGEILWDLLREEPEHMLRHRISPLTAMQAVDHYERLVLLGDPGSGKSTFVGFLALGLTGHLLDTESDWLDRLANQDWTHGSLMPIHITLRDFAQDMGDPAHHGTAQSLLGYIERQLEKCGCGDGLLAVQEEMTRGEALLLLDGLDEVPADRRETVRDAVSAILAAYDCRVLITCRILSYANPEWQIPNTATVTLAPFDEEKITHFVEAWYTASVALGNIDAALAETRVVDLTEAVRDRRLQDMASNPMLLTVMAIVHNHRGALPRETARLYQECVEILMWKWKPDAARHLREELKLGDESDLYRILWQIAYEAHERQSEQAGAADIPKSEVMAIVAEDHLDGDYTKAQRFCDYVEERAGLLVGRGGADHQRRVYAFPHRTFQEFLAGCHIADHVDFVEIIGEKACLGANWREVVLLAIGQMVFNKIDRNQPIAAVQYILAADPVNDADWQAAWLAGEMLLLLGRQTVEKHRVGVQVLKLACDRLADLVSGGHMESIERAAAGRTLSQLGDPRLGVGLREDGLPDIDWVEIPDGEFIYQYGQQLTLPTYHISRYPVTYDQFQAFINAEDGFYNLEWWRGLPPGHSERKPDDQTFDNRNHPREKVSWYDAIAFCRWLTAKLGSEVRLPTEQEWHKAARGIDGREYPWGDGYRSNHANLNEKQYNVGPYFLSRTTAVGSYPQGASPYGILDLAGNVFEWCLNDYEDLVYTQLADVSRRIVRGGAWDLSQSSARCTSRFEYHPSSRNSNIGFRIVCVFSFSE